MAYKERFKQARELNRLTQAQVADVVGVNQSAIAHIENGRRVPTADLIQGIAQATRVTSAFFERKPVAPFPHGSLTYRARSVARAADRGQAYQFVSLLVEQTQIMADHLSLPQLLLPQSDNPVEGGSANAHRLGSRPAHSHATYHQPLRTPWWSYIQLACSARPH